MSKFIVCKSPTVFSPARLLSAKRPQGIGKEGHIIWSIGLEKQWTFLPENDFKLGLRSRLQSERIPQVLFSLVFTASGSVICVLR